MTTLNTDVFEVRMLEYYAYILACLPILASYFFGSENARRPVTVLFDLILVGFAYNYLWSACPIRQRELLQVLH